MVIETQQLFKKPNPIEELNLEQAKKTSTSEVIANSTELNLPPANPSLRNSDLGSGLNKGAFDVSQAVQKTLSGLILGQELSASQQAARQKAVNGLGAAAALTGLAAGAIAVIKEYNSPAAIARREAVAKKEAEIEKKEETLAQADKQKQELEAQRAQKLRDRMKDRVNITIGAELMAQNQTKGGALTAGSSAATQTQQELDNAISISAKEVKDKLEKQRGSLEDPKKKAEKQRQEGTLEVA